MPLSVIIHDYTKSRNLRYVYISLLVTSLGTIFYYFLHEFCISDLINQSLLGSLKENLSNFIDKNYERDNANFIKLLVLNIRDDDILTDKVASLGIFHLFAVSGFHFGIIHYFIMIIFKKQEKTGNIVCLVTCAVYTIILGISIGSLRSLVMQIITVFLLFNNKHKLTGGSKLLIAAVVILILEPANFMGYGFFLSFGCSAIITILNNYYFENKMIRTLIIGVLAFSFSLPLTIKFNGGFSVLSIINGYIFGLIVCPVFVICFFLVFIPLFIPLVSFIATITLNIIDTLSSVDQFIEIDSNLINLIVIYYQL